MKQTKLTSIAYKAMQDAMAAGKDDQGIIAAGAMALRRVRKGDTEKNIDLARGIFKERFELRDAN